MQYFFHFTLTLTFVVALILVVDLITCEPFGMRCKKSSSKESSNDLWRVELKETNDNGNRKTVTSFSYGNQIDGYNELCAYNDGYLRCTKPNSPWGGSVIIIPQHWDGENLIHPHQYTENSFVYEQENECLELEWAHQYGSLNMNTAIRISPMVNNRLCFNVTQNIDGVLGDVERTNYWRPFLISTMYISKHVYDSKSVIHDDKIEHPIINGSTSYEVISQASKSVTAAGGETPVWKPAGTNDIDITIFHNNLIMTTYWTHISKSQADSENKDLSSYDNLGISGEWSEILDGLKFSVCYT